MSLMQHLAIEFILQDLQLLGKTSYLHTVSRLGINTATAYGVPMPALRSYAKKLGKNHSLATKLWDCPIHEARILATLIDNPKQVTEEQMEKWVSAINSWDICDHCCSNLFCHTSFAFDKALQWSSRKEEFVKRAGFVLMATLAVHNKKADNELFMPFFPVMEREAKDERNYVKKAINWALRQMGKRNHFLHAAAILTAKNIALQNYSSARWIASDALNELNNEKIIRRLKT